jgi:DNA invertase Pin-like site-specific DNA recombinase
VLSVFATVARFESQRRSDRVKAHIGKVKPVGGHWGRAGARQQERGRHQRAD